MAFPDYTPLELRRGTALQDALKAANLWGTDNAPVVSLVRTAPNTITPTFRDSATAQQQADATALIASHDWTAAGELPDNRTAAVALAATSADAIPIGSRATASVMATRDNDQSETLKALCDLLGVTTEQLAARITLNRVTTPPPAGAPTPADVVTSATVRLDAVAVFGQIVGYIEAGVGDPPQ